MELIPVSYNWQRHIEQSSEYNRTTKNLLVLVTTDEAQKTLRKHNKKLRSNTKSDILAFISFTIPSTSIIFVILERLYLPNDSYWNRIPNEITKVNQKNKVFMCDEFYLLLMML